MLASVACLAACSVGTHAIATDSRVREVADAAPDATTTDGAVAPDGSRGAVVDSVCDSDRWCWESPLPQGDDVVSIWATSLDDVWMATAPGPILHWNGVGWTSFAVGASGASGAPGGTAIWGNAANDVWAVGTAVGHWNGTAWTTFDAPAHGALASIWGTSATNVWAVGGGGVTLHFDGAGWRAVDSGSSANLVSVWVAPSGDAWASGGGSLLHFDGRTWSTTWAPALDAAASGFPPPELTLRVLGGTSSTDVWGFQAPQSVWHYDGVSWATVPGATGLGAYAIAAIAPDDVWFLGSGLVHYDGRTWTTVSQGAETMLSGCALGKNSVLAAGTAGQIYKWDGKSFWQFAKQITNTGVCLGVSSVWASAPDDAWAVGGWGTIFHSDGRSWTEVKSECASGGGDQFVGVSGSAHDNVWAVGRDSGGAGLAYRWDGSTWSKIALPASTLELDAVWTDGPGDLWAVGPHDRLHFDGNAWSAFDVGGDTDSATAGGPELRALWGTRADDLWAVGARATAARWDGAKWTALQIPAAFPYDFDAVWGTSDNDVWVSGESGYDALGAVLHWDGTSWHSMLSASQVSGVWGTSPGDVWTTVCDPDPSACFVDHWDGSSWQHMFHHRVDFPARLVGLPATGDVWAFGGEMIAHRRP